MISTLNVKEWYFVYHAPFANKNKGKVGCTKRPRKRLAEQGLKLGHDCEILIAISSKLPAKVVGDVEFLLAEYFNYARSQHYAIGR
jgi:hypothetical protein